MYNSAPPSLATIAARYVTVDLADVVSQKMGLCHVSAEQIIAHQLCITAEIVFQVTMGQVNGTLTTYVGVGSGRVLVSTAYLTNLQREHSSVWEEFLARPGIILDTGSGITFLFLPSTELRIGTEVRSPDCIGHHVDVCLPHDEGVKIVWAIASTLQAHGL
jgi:hypothetical protein